VCLQGGSLARQPELSPELRAGTRALEGLDGLDWNGGLDWSPEVSAWHFPCQLRIDAPEASRIPAVTPWWVLVADTYPAGRLDFLPAKQGGIEWTFPHQSYNAPGNPKLPWRQGKLCLHTGITPLKSHGFRVEPMEAGHRLAWNVQRARCWLQAAARGELLSHGDRFELPDFRSGKKGRLAFRESSESFARWQKCPETAGYVRFLELPGEGMTRVIAGFESPAGEDLFSVPKWGTWLGQKASEGPLGVWIRLDRLPPIEPWQAPMSWKELDGVLGEQGVKLLELLPRLLEKRLRSSGLDPGERQRHPLLIGFPIPERVGESPRQMHWVGFQLPPLAEGNEEVANGFRPGAKGHFQQDLGRLRKLHPLPWLKSQSWSDEDLTGRGRLPDLLRESRILLLGAGALGASVAELLVRGGCRRLLTFDSDTLEAGNLVRHSLTMAELGQNKAQALTERLNGISPHASVEGVAAHFPDIPPELKSQVQSADLVLDCTADPGVLMHLERYPWPGNPRTFIRLSLGLRGQRLYCFTARDERFPRQHYVEAVTPWVEKDWEGVEEKDLPVEGLGCWNPLMPARAVDVQLLAATAVRFLASLDLEALDSSEGRLTVFDQGPADGPFEGVRRISPEESS